MDLSIPDMSCGHCSAAITRAVTALDPNATLTFDMAARRAHVESPVAAETLIAALDAIGFPAQRL